MKVLNKVWLVTKGEYSERYVVGVCTTRKKAEKLKRLCASENAIEDMLLDRFPKHPRGRFLYKVVMYRNGDVHRTDLVDVTVPGDFFAGTDEFGARKYGPVDDATLFVVWAKDEKYAVKIANEKRTQLLALNRWPDKKQNEPAVSTGSQDGGWDIPL